MPRHWRQRMLATTRGQVIALLRRGPRTVNELAGVLELTDNGVRMHLSALERDGLVEQAGVRRGLGKPAHVYRLTAEADSLFPKGYAAVLGEVLGHIREKQGSEALVAFLRDVGRRAGARSRSDAPALADRVDAAAGLLTALGGLVEVKETDDAFLIQGFSCPLAALMEDNPEACALAEELVGGVVGVPAEECCDRTGTPRCAFRIARSEQEADSFGCN